MVKAETTTVSISKETLSKIREARGYFLTQNPQARGGNGDVVAECVKTYIELGKSKLQSKFTPKLDHKGKPFYVN